MRTDKALGEDLIYSKDWNDDKPDEHLLYNVYEVIEENGQKRLIMHSLSGWERNHLFMNKGSEFEDVSLISGMDSVSDTRAHCTLDFNRDGYPDVALVNANAPHLQVYMNRLRELSSEPNNFVAVKLIGGNATDQPSTEWSCRDAVGALIDVTTTERTYVREMRFGEGFAAQNSSTLIFGTGRDSRVDLKVRWPSGKSNEFKDIEVGRLVKVFENPDESVNGSGLDVEDYLPSVMAVAQGSPNPIEDRFAVFDETRRGQYQLVVSMATWCAACKKNAPQVKRLKEYFGEGIGLYGLPIDPNDSTEKLNGYIESQQPAYELLINATPDQREAFETLVHRTLGKVVLPSTAMVNGDGAVVATWLGVPSVSEVAETIDKHGTLSGR